MISAIVLAAGYSSRMGTQKLLLPFGEKTVISHIVDQILSSSIEKVYVVTGHQAEKVGGELSDKPVRIVNNPEYQSGMLSSVRAGLRDISQECEAVLVALGDQPSIKTELIDRLIQSFSSTQKKIIVPLHNGKHGHPILFSITYCDEILTNYDDIGLRGILHAHNDDVFEMNVSSPAVLSDMDNPDDYRRELKEYENKQR
jgi:molybdenum cofactor cytidylyltransferase